MPPVSLNTFLDLPVQYNRSPRTYGPAIEVAPSSWYDKHTERFFVAIATFDRDASTTRLQGGWLDVAVSDGCDPTGEAQVGKYFLQC